MEERIEFQLAKLHKMIIIKQFLNSKKDILQLTNNFVKFKRFTNITMTKQLCYKCELETILQQSITKLKPLIAAILHKNIHIPPSISLILIKFTRIINFSALELTERIPMLQTYQKYRLRNIYKTLSNKYKENINPITELPKLVISKLKTLS